MRRTIQTRSNQKHAKVLIKRVEVDVLNRQLVFFKPVHLSPALGGTNMNPVGCLVTYSGKAIFLNKSLHEHRPVAIDLLPVNGQSFSAKRQDL
jgi:hypothetical protein